jgi:16S rRNA (uracil1498-N3)-methyltransferase
VPKGERADWMVEKLSEVGCAAFVPLVADRSVVTPKGTGKHDRWVRLATESAKQCRRRGVMRIDAPIPLDVLLARLTTAGRDAADAARDAAAAAAPAGRPPVGWFLDTGAAAVPVRRLLLTPAPPADLTLLVGPEGGWSPGEVDRMLGARLTPVALTRTILRVETAAVAAAACVAALWAD